MLPPRALPGRHTAVPHNLVGNEAFLLKCHIMMPYPARGLIEEQRIFNYRLSRARRFSENCFGILVNRFAVLKWNETLPRSSNICHTSLHCCVQLPANGVWFSLCTSRDTTSHQLLAERLTTRSRQSHCCKCQRGSIRSVRICQFEWFSWLAVGTCVKKPLPFKSLDLNLLTWNLYHYKWSLCDIWIRDIEWFCMFCCNYITPLFYSFLLLGVENHETLSSEIHSKSRYTSLIAPHFNNNILLWGFKTHILIKLQKRAIRSITDSKLNSHTEPLLKSYYIKK